MKPKACKVCSNKFEPTNSFQKVCSPGCGIRYSLDNPKFMERVSKAVDKAQNAVIRRSKREAIERLTTRSEWLKRAQISFNRYIRSRDKGQPCISCGRASGCKVNAGHYRTVKAAPELRFNEANVHLQCESCNSYKSGNILEYRIGLIKRIGLQAVEELEGPHEPLKLTIDEIRELIETYKRKLKDMD